MKKLLGAAAVLFGLAGNFYAQNNTADSLMLRRIADYYLSESQCYSNLEYLCTRIGGRLSGSPQAAQAVEWARQAMYAAGADTVYLQPCMVPHWVRGEKEQCRILSSASKIKTLNICALGGSVATPAKGIQAEVIEVHSFEELDQLGEAGLKGKIVFYNVFFNSKNLYPGTSYGETVKYRSTGASRAGRYGAVATIVRSMSTASNDFPHTGAMWYDTTLTKTKIPTCAISYKGGDALSTLLKQEAHLKLFLKMSCQTLPDAPSFNVIGEIRGSRFPQEYIVAGGHLDSWDNGQGAHDDGSGVVQCIELLRMYKKLGIRPQHSVRAVAFMNEENGSAGGKAYAKEVEEKQLKHLVALETDAGGFVPRSIGVDTLHGAYSRILGWKPLLDPYFLQYINQGGGGADISHLSRLGIPLIGFEPEGQRYFDYHHTADDTFDKINKRELELGANAIGGLIYLIDKYGL